MSPEAQLHAWVTVMTPAFTALLVFALVAVVVIVWDDMRPRKHL